MARSQPAPPRIGISGWTYAPWRGVFYPNDLPQARELHHASRMINSIEINGTFYSMQRPSSFQTWYDSTPDDFLFAVKGSRFITHMKRLRDIEIPLANFLASGLLNLREKLGPILWQFPPQFAFDAQRMGTFFRQLPQDTVAAAKLARRHDDRLKGRALTRARVDLPMRYAVEIRHPSFQTPRFIELLRQHNIALVIADTAGRWPYTEDITADFVYLRLHGDEEIYASGYSSAALDRWADRLATWGAGGEPADACHWITTPPPPAKSRDLYVYFDNDVKVKAPFDAMGLAERLGPAARGQELRDRATPASPKLTRKALAERVRSHWPAPVQRAKPRRRTAKPQ